MKLHNLDLCAEYLRLIGDRARSEHRHLRPKSFQIRPTPQMIGTSLRPLPVRIGAKPTHQTSSQFFAKPKGTIACYGIKIFCYTNLRHN